MSISLYKRFGNSNPDTYLGKGDIGMNRYNRNGHASKISSSLDLPLTKKYFKLLQAIHHSEILEHAMVTSGGLPGMQKQVNKLAAFIKPSSPTEETLNKVKQNTSDWMKTNMLILQEHYDKTLATGLQTLSSFNKEALEKAVMWGRTRYKCKLTSSSIQTLDRLIRTPLSLSIVDQDGLALPSLSQALPTMGRPSYARVVSGERMDTTIKPSMEESGPSLPQRTPKSVYKIQAIIEPEARKTHNNTPSLNNKPEANTYHTYLSDPHVGLTNSNTVVPCSNNISVVSSPDVDEQVSQAVAEQVSVEAMVEMKGQDMMMKHTENDDNHSELQSESSSSPKNLTPDLSTEPVPATRQEPQKHLSTNRKGKDWAIKITKPTVILGDSNLSQIPPFIDPLVQVDSFPGANFFHLKETLEKLTPNECTENIVLAAGLNNCLSRQTPTTTWKQLQQLLKTSSRKFPNATVHVPLINFSDRLDKDQQDLLYKLNETIANKCNFLPDLSNRRFRTLPRDPVLWTPETAKEILEGWLEEINASESVE